MINKFLNFYCLIFEKELKYVIKYILIFAILLEKCKQIKYFRLVKKFKAPQLQYKDIYVDIYWTKLLIKNFN